MTKLEEFIDDYDDNEKLVSWSTRRYDRVHDALLDTGIRPIVGLQTYEVYYAIRRFIWRGSEGFYEVLKLREKGMVAAYAKQDKIAACAGLSRQRVNVHIDRLRALGWLKTLPLPNNALAYDVGYLATPPGEFVDMQAAEEIFYKDGWERRFYSAMTKWAVDVKHMPLTKLPFDDRVEFAIAYLARKHSLGASGLRIAR